MTRTIGIALILIGIAFITYAVLNKPKSMQLVEIEYSCKDWRASELNRIKVELKREYHLRTGDWVQFVEVKR